MGKVMKKIGGFVGKVAKIASPILNIAKMIPGVGQIAGMVSAGLSIAANFGKMLKKGFPAGLVDAAMMAAKQFLPGPLAKVTDFVQNKVGKLKDLVPAGVQKFLPQVNLPIVRDLKSVL